MDKLLHIKGSRTKVLSSLPTNSFGSDGDIVLSAIKGKGFYLCAKINGRWFVSNKLEDLKKMEKTSIRDLSVDKLKIKNTTLTKDELNKPVGDLTFDVGGDIALSADGGNITMNDGTTTVFDFDVDGVNLKMMDDADTGDYFNILVAAAGATTLSTVDDDGATAHLKLQPDGKIIMEMAAQDSEDDAWAITNNSHNMMTFKTEGGAENYLKIYEAGSPGVDYFQIEVQQNAITNFTTYDAAGSNANLKLDPDGELLLTPVTEVKSDTPLKIKEAAAAVADTNGYGQIWVKNTDPEELCFTDAGGTDVVGIGKYYYETKMFGYYGNNSYAWLPFAGYIFEGSSTTGRNEYQAFIAPYNGTIVSYQARSEIAQGGSNHSFRVNEASDGTEIPGTLIYRKDYDPGATADDTVINWDFSSPSTGTDPIVLTKGRLYMIYVAFAAASYDTNVTLVFKWDITS
tara:strand:- start:859 stop:2229 length:1371 start_codon:yes stop_codon:yes gene_type:complete